MSGERNHDQPGVVALAFTHYTNTRSFACITGDNMILRLEENECDGDRASWILEEEGRLKVLGYQYPDFELMATATNRPIP